MDVRSIWSNLLACSRTRFLGGLKETGTEQVREALLAAIGLAQYFFSYEQMHHLFCFELVDNKLLAG